MPTKYAHDIEQILSVYVEAKLDSAARELLQARQWVEAQPDAYTEGKLLWAQHQFAAVKIVYRDIRSWRSVIKRYFRRLKKRGKVSCSASQQQSVAS